MLRWGGHQPHPSADRLLKTKEPTPSLDTGQPTRGARTQFQQGTGTAPPTGKLAQISRPASPTRGLTPEARKLHPHNAGHTLARDQLGSDPTH